MQQAAQAVRHAAAADFALAVFDVAQGGMQHGGRNALFRRFFQGRPDALVRIGDLLLRQAFHADVEHHLADARIAAIHVRWAAIAGRFHGAHDGRRRFTEQAVRQQMRVVIGDGVARLAHQPGKLQAEFIVARFLRRNLDDVFLWRRPGGRQLRQAALGKTAEFGQHALRDLVLHGRRFDIAGSHDHGLRRMVVAGVEFFQHFMCQLGDVARIAARFHFIRRALEQGAGDAAVKRAHGAVESALHFIEDDALVHQLVAFERMAPAFLAEVQVIEVGEEGRVQVHVEQVEEILAVGAGERVHGAVRIGHRIHEGGRRAAQHREERVAHRVARRAAQGQVFEDVGAPVAYFGHSGKGHQEHHLSLLGMHVDMAHARCWLDILLDGCLQDWNEVAADFFKCAHAVWDLFGR